jgi:hypothetical protein
MTTGRINQVACRAREQQRHECELATPLPADPQRHRPSGNTPDKTHFRPCQPSRGDTEPSEGPAGAPLAAARACAVLILWGRAPRAVASLRPSWIRRRDPACARLRQFGEHAPAGRRTERPLRPAGTCWPPAARSYRGPGHHARTGGALRRRLESQPPKCDAHPRGVRDDLPSGCGRARSHAVQGHPPPPRPCGRRRTERPLHASICTERLRRVAKPFTQPDLPARACPRPAEAEHSQARPPHPESQCHALPRAPRLSLSWARRSPAAPEKTCRPATSRPLAPAGSRVLRRASSLGPPLGQRVPHNNTRRSTTRPTAVDK